MRRRLKKEEEVLVRKAVEAQIEKIRKGKLKTYTFEEVLRKLGRSKKR